MKKLILAKGRDILLKRTGSGLMTLPTDHDVDVDPDSECFEYGCYLASASGCADPEDGRFVVRGLRESWGMMPEEEYQAASKGMELLNWNVEERFCGRDGAALERFSPISKRCPVCGKEYFPRLDPAVVVLVKRGEQALLVHARSLRKPVMALVAGFVETGESLEECVRREVMEETSLEIADIRYYGSQSWPFPHQLMMGFVADYKSGEISFADGELAEGGFFSRETPPPIPAMPSLSRMIIDAWLRGEI